MTAARVPGAATGAVHDSEILVAVVRLTRRPVGAHGGSAAAVVSSKAGVAVPVPASLSARTWNKYLVPGTSPLTVWLVLVEPVSVQSPKLSPSSVLSRYW